MSDRETNFRSILFLVIGILLLLSLVICIYIVSGEKDLVETEATVVDIKKDSKGTGKNTVYVSYEVNGSAYRYEYSTKEDLNLNDKVTIFYHENSETTVQTFKVNKIIFVCPVIGLVLCILGLYELFKKRDVDDEEDFKTSVIGVVGNTQQLKIVTDDAPVKEYVKTPEEKVEAPVKAVKKEAPKPEVVVNVQEVAADVTNVEPKTAPAAPVPAPAPAKPAEVPLPKPAPKMVDAIAPVKKEEPNKPVAVIIPKPEAPKAEVPKPAAPASVEEAIAKKVQNNISEDKSSSLSQDDIKNLIKDVLKDVIQEVKEEKAAPEPVEQKRVLPNYYYISGTSLIYEEAGKDSKEIDLKDIKKIVRTVNSAGNVVKLIVSNDAVKCVLTNMKNIDLEQVASLLNNKMRTIDESFEEEIEYKEY